MSKSKQNQEPADPRQILVSESEKPQDQPSASAGPTGTLKCPTTAPSKVKPSIVAARRQGYVFTSESVSEGHPDKVCDFIADSILDAYLAEDPSSRVACEVLCKGNTVVIAGEITSTVQLDHEGIARHAVQEVGYVDEQDQFNAKALRVVQLITRQAPEIDKGVDRSKNLFGDQGAGDQGIMFGFATSETTELMPLPILLAHRLTRGLAEDRKSAKVPWLYPDSKSQVSVLYEDNEPIAVTDVLVSTQHSLGIGQDEITDYVVHGLAPRALGEWFHNSISFSVNPTGSFIHGGPAVDCGVTGRKIIVDSYGGVGHHGGGAFSGKDPSKVDRSGAYYCRWIARQLIENRISGRAEIQVAYAIGKPQPVSVKVDTFGTGDQKLAEDFVSRFDFRPAAIIKRLNLLRPIYRQTTNYGHFGKKGLPWEEPTR